MRLKPRFSVRTLAVVVTFVCAYFGAWEATKRYGTESGIDTTSPMPFIVVQTDLVEIPKTMLADPYTYSLLTRQVYLWLFGLKIKLPFGSTTTFDTIDMN